MNQPDITHYHQLLLEQAFALQNAGQLVEAAELFKQVLALMPQHAGLLTHLGGLMLHLGNIEESMVYNQRSIMLDGGQAVAHCHLGLGLQLSNQPEAALASYAQALQLNPAYPEAYFNQGNVLKALGRYIEALHSFDQLLVIRADHVDAYIKRAEVLDALQRYEEALLSYDCALGFQVDHAHAHVNRSVVLQKLERFDQALQSVELAIQYQPELAEAHYNRGVVLNALEQYESAAASYRCAIAVKADFAEAYSNLGLVLIELKRLDEALQSCKAAIAFKADLPEAYANLGMVLHAQQRYQEALTAYERAIRINPGLAKAYFNQGVVLNDLQHREQAIQSYHQAIAIRPDYAEAYCNLGNVLQEFQRYPEAMNSYDVSISCKPNFAEAYTNKALLHLLLGDFKSGLVCYQWRWFLPINIADWRGEQALWLGESSLAGKTILLYAEQGLGDTLQFCRYIAEVVALGAKVILEVQPTLLSLCASLEVPLTLIVRGQSVPYFDYQCPLLSLPLAFQTNLQTIPHKIPYLFADKQKIQSWRQKLAGSGYKVGLVWSGSANHKNDHNRSLAFKQLLPLLALPIEFHVLQKEYKADEDILMTNYANLYNHRQELHDFSDTAALLECLDLVISVDTSVAHLAGAMGKPVWILLPANPDFRWLLERSDSPWYPTATLFRQGEDREWSTVISAVQQSLINRLLPG